MANSTKTTITGSSIRGLNMRDIGEHLNWEHHALYTIATVDGFLIVIGRTLSMP